MHERPASWSLAPDPPGEHDIPGFNIASMLLSFAAHTSVHLAMTLRGNSLLGCSHSSPLYSENIYYARIRALDTVKQVSYCSKWLSTCVCIFASWWQEYHDLQFACQYNRNWVWELTSQNIQMNRTNQS